MATVVVLSFTLSSVLTQVLGEKQKRPRFLYIPCLLCAVYPVKTLGGFFGKKVDFSAQEKKLLSTQQMWILWILVMIPSSLGVECFFWLCFFVCGKQQISHIWSERCVPPHCCSIPFVVTRFKFICSTSRVIRVRVDGTMLDVSYHQHLLDLCSTSRASYSMMLDVFALQKPFVLFCIKLYIHARRFLLVRFASESNVFPSTIPQTSFWTWNCVEQHHLLCFESFCWVFCCLEQFNNCITLKQTFLGGMQVLDVRFKSIKRSKALNGIVQHTHTYHRYHSVMSTWRSA